MILNCPISITVGTDFSCTTPECILWVLFWTYWSRSFAVLISTIWQPLFSFFQTPQTENKTKKPPVTWPTRKRICCWLCHVEVNTHQPSTLPKAGGGGSTCHGESLGSWFRRDFGGGGLDTAGGGDEGSEGWGVDSLGWLGWLGLEVFLVETVKTGGFFEWSQCWRFQHLTCYTVEKGSFLVLRSWLPLTFRVRHRFQMNEGEVYRFVPRCSMYVKKIWQGSHIAHFGGINANLW